MMGYVPALCVFWAISRPPGHEKIKCNVCRAPRLTDPGVECSQLGVDGESSCHSLDDTHPPEWWCTDCARFANPVCPTHGEEVCAGLGHVRHQCRICGKIDSCTLCVGDGELDYDSDCESDMPSPEKIRIFKADRCDGCRGQVLSPEEVKAFVKKERDAKFESE